LLHGDENSLYKLAFIDIRCHRACERRRRSFGPGCPTLPIQLLSH